MAQSHIGGRRGPVVKKVVGLKVEGRGLILKQGMWFLLPQAEGLTPLASFARFGINGSWSDSEGVMNAE